MDSFNRSSVFTVTYAYTSDGRDAGYTVTLTNGTILSRAVVRDPYRRHLVTAITNSVDSAVVSSHRYSHNLLDRATRRIDGGTVTNSFGYNPRSEVTGASLGTNAYTYAYDGIGNRLAATNNAVATLYTSSPLNQYTNIVEGVAPSTPHYDPDGNMVSNGVWSYSWDAENRLVAAHSNATLVVSNAYDHAHRRVLKVTPTATHTYLYDGWNLVQETVQTQQSTVTNRFVWGCDLSGSTQGAGGVGGLLAVQMSGAWYFPLADHNGNITAYVDESGTTVASYTYDAFGRTIAASGPMADAFHFRFSTKYLDSESDLYYYGYRFYSPELGRWLSRDPVAERGGANLYGFCRNNPVKYFDTLGDTPLDVRAARIRAYLEAGAEDMAADEALLLYRNIAWGGEFVEPLAASLMKNWLDGAPEDPFTIPSRHVKRAMLYDEPAGTSPKDQLESQLCALVPNPTSGASGSLSGSALNLRATQGVYYHAFGGFKITFTGTYDCNRSARCKFKGNWEFYDKYDWHDGLDATVAGTTIPDAWALLVEEYHGAKLFKEDGNWRGTVKVNCPCTTASSPGGR